MKSNLKLIVPICLVVGFSVVSLSSAPAHAELDKASQDALEQTQRLLKDQKQRTEAMKGNDSAQQNHRSIEGFSGSAANTDAVYSISADVIATIVKDSGGDMVKMQEKLMEAQKNPEAFLKSLPAEQRSKIEALGKKIEGETTPRSPSNRP